MNRFAQSCLFDRIALNGGLSPEVMIALADAIAAFHRDADAKPSKGGAEAMCWVMDDNIEKMRRFLISSSAPPSAASPRVPDGRLMGLPIC